MNLQEKSIDCFDCGITFTFSVEEQQAYQDHGYTHVPKRCLSCRESRKARQIKNCNLKTPQYNFQLERRLYSVTCFQCGKNTQVPFEPKAGRPVYCRECYHPVKQNI